MGLRMFLTCRLHLALNSTKKTNNDRKPETSIDNVFPVGILRKVQPEMYAKWPEKIFI